MDQTPEAGGSTPVGATPAATASPAAGIRCDQCGETVPQSHYCVRCGDPLDAEKRRGRLGRVRDSYAAAPDERATAVRLVSTLYPSLPHEEIRTFQLALLGGTALVVVLGLLGFFPVAIVAAAILVPLVTVIYLYDVDTYEDEPVRVVAFTFLWGLLVGALFTFLIDQVLPANAREAVGGSVTGAGGSGFPFVRGIVIPAVSVLLMIAGPAVLLPYKRFNDVLDGATFGVASGVAFIGAQTLVNGVALFHSGLRPVGDILPWVVRLLALGVAMPLIAAGAIGGLGGVLWLRYRAPVRDRAVLKALGQPVVAAVVAVVFLVVAALAQLLVPDVGGGSIAGLGVRPGEVAALAVLVVEALIALIWLRRVIHIGLLQESREIPIGDPIECPNCGEMTPLHSFCGNCGVALKALPRSRGAAPAGGPAGIAAAASPMAGGKVAPIEVPVPLPADLAGGPLAGTAVQAAAGRATATAEAAPAGTAHKAWLSQRGILAIFGVVLLGSVLVAAGVAYVVSQGRDRAHCPDKSLPCAGSAPFAAGLRASLPRRAATADAPFSDRQAYTDKALGFGFQFDPDVWEVAQKDAGFVLLSAGGGSVVLIIEGAPADQFDAESIFEARHGLLGQQLLGLATDTEPARLLLGSPLLGYHKGIGGLFGGAFDTGQGPTIDFTAAEVAATDGTIAVVATLLAPVELRDAGLQAGDSVLGSFTWPTDEVPQ